jgi:FlaA1/EpsC-like NDP-sugar epimerase
MIELSGFTPEEDIQIEYTGLRPGEKLYEEPIHQAENVRPTNHLKVKCLIGRGRDTAILSELRNLEKQLYRMSDAELKQWLALRVPEYKIWNSEKN